MRRALLLLAIASGVAGCPRPPPPAPIPQRSGVAVCEDNPDVLWPELPHPDGGTAAPASPDGGSAAPK